MLARTEVIRAHHLATIQEYRNYGVEGIHVQGEWKTAGDMRVCDICASMEGQVFTLDQIEKMIPAHTMCRCLALPAVRNVEKKITTPTERENISTLPITEKEQAYLSSKKINITENAKYAGQDMDWTETFTGEKVLQKDTLFYHGSNNKIKAFRSKNTCFHMEDALLKDVKNTTIYEGNKVGNSIECETAKGYQDFYI
jgi:hypothetical protein